ncbi:MAG: hypothetical protein V2A64_02530 [Candidatus Omnitrophota bacterium]
MDNNSQKQVIYNYKFIFSSGKEKTFEVKLDARTLNLIRGSQALTPEWTRLEFFKCPNCPLNEAEYKFCPVAINMAELIDFFKDLISYEEVDVIIDTQERKYTKRAALQYAVGSLVGIYMVTSGCALLEKLKPMVRFHLPFATPQETTYRALSMYLVSQYFLYKRGKQPDWDLKNLAKIYSNVRVVNENFCKRLTSLDVEDASLNAVVMLDLFASYVNFFLEENMVEEIEQLFSPYL